jgi:hypothetical protein
VKETGGTVIIEKLDRLARDLMVSESILADFQRKAVTDGVFLFPLAYELKDNPGSVAGVMLCSTVLPRML